MSLYAIGSELSSLSTDAHAARWRAVTGQARGAYHGPLTYVANHDALDLRAPLQYVDVVGVSAYFPLAAGPDAPDKRLRWAWSQAAAQLAELAERTGKPTVIMEVGYPSVDGGAVTPWDYTTGAPIDLEEQRAAYAAFVDQAMDAEWLGGAMFWTWFGPGGPHDRHFTPRGKPAEGEMRRLLTRRGNVRR